MLLPSPVTLFRNLYSGSARTHPYPEQFEASMDLPLFVGAPRLYLIASTPRCGSHFLGHALMRTGHFGIPLEYLNEVNLGGWRDRFGPGDAAFQLERLIACRTSASRWFGIKAHWNQFEAHSDGALFARHGGFERAIFLYRRDLLSQAISYLRAAQTGRYISGAASQGEPRYDYGRLVKRADTLRRQNAAWADYLASRFGKPVLPVVYEDLLAQPDSLSRIGRFLDPGSPVAPAPAERVRRQSDSRSAEWRARALADLRDEHRWLQEPQSWLDPRSDIAA